MIVSQNEVYRLSQRVMEGLGAPFGVDRDGAFAVTWLEARGLGGLSALACALDRLDGDFQPFAQAKGTGAEVTILDAAGGSALAHAGALIDYAEMLEDGAETRKTGLRISRLSDPLFLLPMALRRARKHWAVTIAWRSGKDEIILRAAPIGGAMLATTARDLDAVLSDPLAHEVAIACRPDRGDDDPISFPTVRDSRALDFNLRASLANGLSVDQSLWQALTAIAARVLVPSSHISREHGAGGGDANR